MKKISFILVSMIVLISCGKGDDSINSEEQFEELMFTGEVISCSDFSVTKFLTSEDFKTVLRVSGAGREELNLTSDYTEFELPNNDLTIEISEWDLSVYDYFCNDVPITNPNKIKSWNAISGSIKIKVSNIEEIGFETHYSITLRLENALFVDSEGENIFIKNLKIDNAHVGWLPG